MRPASILTTALLALAGAMTVAGAAAAQSAPPPGETRGLRYLSWSGRGPVPAAPVEAEPVRPAAPRRDLRRPNTVIPHGGFAAAPVAPPARPGLTPAPGSGRTLTPANAWLQPRPLPPEPAPPALTVARAPAAAPAAPAARAAPDYLPDQGGRGQPMPAEAVYAPPPAAATVDPMAPRRDAPIFRMESAAPPALAPETPVDPMAPRRDAPIFRMESSAPVQPAAVPPPAGEPAAAEPGSAPGPRRLAEVAPTGERPPVSNARYYSVHRQNGRQPDALEMPAPSYVDALAVTMVETPASQDLAEPGQGPTLIRDAQGRVRPAPAASDGDHQ